METTTESAPGVGELLHRISDDAKVLVRDEMELVKEDLKAAARNAAVDAAVALLGGIVGLIGMGMLCATAVVALEPVIHPLWLRLLLMSILYLVSGGAVATAFGVKLKNDAMPHLGVAKYEGKRTIAGIKETLVKKENASHA